MFKSLNKSISAPIAIIIILLCAVLVGIIAIWCYLKIPRDETANWKTYRNEEYGFEIKYPKNWTIEEEVKEYTDSIVKKMYRLNIFHPENITKANLRGSVTIGFFNCEDNDEFFEIQLDLLKKLVSKVGTLEKITIDGVKGFKGTEYYQFDEAKGMAITELFPDKKNQGIFMILTWSVDLNKELYQEKTKLIISTFRFIE